MRAGGWRKMPVVAWPYVTFSMAHERAPEELLARVVKRDEAALGELYERFAPRLLGMLLRTLRDRDAAYEVLLKTFVRLWNHARPVAQQEPASVAAWLVIVARWLAIDRLRHDRGLPALPRGKPDVLEKSPSWLPRPQEIARLEERRDLLKKLLNQLPKPQYEALEYAVFEGYTEAEIAQKLGEPLGRVRTGLRAGLSFLRHRLRAVLGTWAANI